MATPVFRGTYTTALLDTFFYPAEIKNRSVGVASKVADQQLAVLGWWVDKDHQSVLKIRADIRTVCLGKK